MTTIFLINKIRVDHQITDTEKVNKINFFKVFVRLHLDYGDILYDQAYNMSFEGKLESTQYDAYLAITAAMRGTSKEKLYQELGLQPLQLQCWFSELDMFYKIFKSKSLSYLFKLISEKNSCICYKKYWWHSLINIRHNFFKNSFFLLKLLNGQFRSYPWKLKNVFWFSKAVP